MNYRHVYHAGNFADVLKHIVLVRIIMHLQRKDKAFRVMDTHAGLGLYDLTSEEAQKTGEWRQGIARLLEAKIPRKIAPILQPYLDVVENSNGAITSYPGSPLIARRLLRKQDRLSLSELHPEDVGVLRKLFAGDYQVRVNELDGWLALGGHLPPKERRGMVLVDPPFEQQGEFDRLIEGVAKAHKRWASGTYCLWYPVKNRRESNEFAARIKELALAKTLRAELYIQSPDNEDALNGCGLIIINPPYTLEADLRQLLPWLAGLLSQGKGSGSCLEWLTGE